MLILTSLARIHGRVIVSGFACKHCNSREDVFGISCQVRGTLHKFIDEMSTGGVELWFKRQVELRKDQTMDCEGTGLSGYPNNMVKNFEKQTKRLLYVRRCF